LCDRLNADGWTVIFPIPVPDDCLYRRCEHTPEDAWANEYVRLGQEVTDREDRGRQVPYPLYHSLTKMWEATVSTPTWDPEVADRADRWVWERLYGGGS
jgi:hypothetical protein